MEKNQSFRPMRVIEQSNAGVEIYRDRSGHAWMKVHCGPGGREAELTLGKGEMRSLAYTLLAAAERSDDNPWPEQATEGGWPTGSVLT